uniref:Uncharacterized protein n=1 Tax=Trichuris muris TaxID=70415 RepID=A0A5S6QG52_TRIMR
MSCFVGASALFLFSPYVMYAIDYFKMDPEEFAAYSDQIYKRNVNRARFGEGLAMPFYTFDLFSKETIRKEKEFHEKRAAEITAEVEKRAEKRRRAQEAQED